MPGRANERYAGEAVPVSLHTPIAYCHNDQVGLYIATASNGNGKALTLQLAACPALSTCDRILWGMSVALAQCQSQRRIHKNVLRHGPQVACSGR